MSSILCVILYNVLDIRYLCIVNYLNNVGIIISCHGNWLELLGGEDNNGKEGNGYSLLCS